MTFLGISVVEWFGYLASVVVALSLTMSSIIKLRWCNLAGAALFSSYGFIIAALPVAFLNLFIVLVDIYYLVRMYREKDDFRIMNLSGADEYLSYFLDCHRQEILRFFPKFHFDVSDGRMAFYLVKNSMPIGVLVGRPQGADGFRIELDYVGPAYRDFRMGRFLYDESGFFHQQGYKRLFTGSGSAGHGAYLKKMGFHPEGDQFVKAI